MVDTNVFVSGVLFGGLPGRILAAWRDGGVERVLTVAILEEYQRVAFLLAERYPGVDLTPILALLVRLAQFVEPEPFAEPVSRDPSDDKFLACSLAVGGAPVISGDRQQRNPPDGVSMSDRQGIDDLPLFDGGPVKYKIALVETDEGYAHDGRARAGRGTDGRAVQGPAALKRRPLWPFPPTAVTPPLAAERVGRRLGRATPEQLRWSWMD